VSDFLSLWNALTLAEQFRLGAVLIAAAIICFLAGVVFGPELLRAARDEARDWLPPDDLPHAGHWRFRHKRLLDERDRNGEPVSQAQERAVLNIAARCGERPIRVVPLPIERSIKVEIR